MKIKGFDWGVGFEGNENAIIQFTRKEDALEFIRINQPHWENKMIVIDLRDPEEKIHNGSKK